MENPHVVKIIQRCLKGHRISQKKLYESYYGYAMNICLRYSNRRDDAVEILNDSFLKAFLYLKKYRKEYPFKTWLRRIIINCCIDHFKRYEKFYPLNENEPYLHEAPFSINLEEETDILSLLQKLSPQYRMVFNLYVMEDYSHREIAEAMNISEGTSRSNLLRAKTKLKELVLDLYSQHKKTFSYGQFLRTN